MKTPFAAYVGDEPYIFVSYAHADANMVYPELVKLRDAGFNIWFDEGIPPGTTWRNELAEALAGCAVFLFFVTPRAAASSNCNKEANYALSKNRHFLSVYLEETELPPGLEFSISDLQAIMKYVSGEQDYREKLEAALKSLMPTDINVIDGHEIVDTIVETPAYSKYLVWQYGMDRQAELVLFDSSARELLERESAIFARFDHPNFASLYSGGSYRDQGYSLFSPEGVWSLNALSSAVRSRIGWYYGRWAGIPLELLISIVRQIAEVFQALDDEDLVLERFDTRKFSITESGRVLLRCPAIFSVNRPHPGDRIYSSPEQLERGQLDIRSNIYSLGLAFYEMLKGQLPFSPRANLDTRAQEIERNIVDIPDDILAMSAVSGVPGVSYSASRVRLAAEYDQFRELLTGMLHPDPSSRYESPESLITALDSVELSPSKDSSGYLSALYSRHMTHRRSDEEQQALLDKAIDPPESILSAIMGEYKSPTYGIVGFSLDDRGKVRFFHEGLFYGSEILAMTETRWELLDFSYGYRFEMREDGSVARLWIIHDNGYEVSVRKTRETSR